MASKPGIYLRGGAKDDFNDPGHEIGDRELVIATDTMELGTSNGFFIPGGKVRNVYFAQTPAERQEITSSEPVVIDGLSLNITPEFQNSSFIVTATVLGTFTYTSSLLVYLNGANIASHDSNNVYQGSLVTTYHGNNTTNNMYSYNLQAMISPQTTQPITIDIRALSHWGTSTYTTYINDRAGNDMRCVSSMVVYEVLS
jgi:hypothetical protein